MVSVLTHVLLNLKKIYVRQVYTKNTRKKLCPVTFAFADDIENWVLESINDTNTIVTEDGTVEDWGGMNKEYKEKILKDLKTYVENLRSVITYIYI